MSKRSEAKKAVRTLARREFLATHRAHLSGYDYDVIEDMLRDEFGYTNASTRRCIINEAFRDVGEVFKRDTQRKKTYLFEDNTVLPILPEAHGAVTNLRNLEALTADLCKALGITVPTIKVGKGTKRSYARGGRLIVLISDMCTPFILLHELTHIIAQQGQIENDGHGPKFMAVNLALQCHVSNFPLIAVLALAKIEKIKIDTKLAQCVYNYLEDSTNVDTESPF